jgi:hypothetical protein
MSEEDMFVVFYRSRVILIEDYSVTLGCGGTRQCGESSRESGYFDNSQRNNLRSCMWVFRVMGGVRDGEFFLECGKDTVYMGVSFVTCSL